MKKKIIVLLILLFSFAITSLTEDKKPLPISSHSEWEKIIKSSKSEGLKGKILNINSGSFVDFNELIKDISTVPVVFVGETLDQLAHHQIQNKILNNLYNKNHSIALGMEMFQRPYQKYLDEYLDGKISEIEMLKKTEYFERWKFNWEFYQPMVQLAKTNNLKIVALDIPSEIFRKVANVGMEGLNKDEKKLLPKEIDTTNLIHKKYFNYIYNTNTELRVQDIKFENYYDAMCLWEDGIADSIAQFFNSNAQGENKAQLIVLAGNEHIIYKLGIPDRTTKRTKLSSRTILPISITEPTNPLITEFNGLAPADYLWFTEPAKDEVNKPEVGIIISPITPPKGGLRIAEIVPNTPAEKAKLQADDIIIALNGEPINKPSDLRLLMINKKIGDEIEFTIIRNNQELKIKITL